jgi:thiol-disulfide isomerase/thioredoxin
MNKRIIGLVAAVLLLAWVLPGQAELLGPITPEDILQSLPDWRSVAASYSPNPQIIAQLQGIREAIQIQIFLGTWCPDSKQHVSSYFKVMDLVQNPLLRTTYIGLPRNKAERQEYTQGKTIERIPTFIVTINGREAGRIVETPRASVEEDLWEIIRGAL